MKDTRKNTILWSVLISSMMFSFQLAGLTGTAILNKVDSVMRSRNSLAVATMTVTTTLGSQRSFTQWSISRGNRSVTKFTSGSVRGMSMLSIDDGAQIWVYFKSSGRTRKLIANARDKSVAGSDFSYSDMSNSKYSKEYYVEGSVQDLGSSWKLVLKPRNPDQIQYSKLILTVDKADCVPRTVVYYNKDGINFKTLTVSEIKTVSGVITPCKFVMKNLLENTTSIIRLQRVKYIQRIDPRFVRQSGLDSSISVWSSYYPFFSNQP